MFHIIFWISCIICLTTETAGTPKNVEKLQGGSSEEDIAFEAFMWVAMRNYSNWLSQYDPFPTIPDEIKLQSDKQIDGGVDASLNIKDQSMVGHSSILERIFTATSELALNTFKVTWSALYSHPIQFRGEYTANGTVELNDQNVCFRGSGQWSLYANESFEEGRIVDFVVNDEGYIDLSLFTGNDHTYLYNVNWTQIEFEDLEIIACEQDQNVASNIAAMSRLQDADAEYIKKALAELYKRFLNTFQRDMFNNPNIPKWLLLSYISHVLSSNKLSDIISDWTPTSTTATDDSSTASSTISNDEKDIAFGDFMWVVMKNYSTWLSGYDPLPPITDEVKLKSDKQVDDGVDASLYIRNQYTRGHSNSLNTIFTAVSELDRNAFSVTRGVSYDQSVKFGGQYTTNGTVELSGQNVCFRGSGEWSLNYVDSFEFAQFVNIEVNDEGYIDLSLTSENYHTYMYNVNWTEIEFEGLQIVTCEQNDNDRVYANSTEINRMQDMNLIKKALAQAYKRFLNSFALENPNDIIPPKRLLFGYLTDILSKNKLSDIISEWSPTTTTTITESSSEFFYPSSKIFLSFVVILIVGNVM